MGTCKSRVYMRSDMSVVVVFLCVPVESIHGFDKVLHACNHHYIMISSHSQKKGGTGGDGGSLVITL